MFDASPRPELLALLAAVKAEPEDDTAKLVLADWLQEQDDEADRARGEWLRLLVHCRRLPLDDIRERGDLGHQLGSLWERYQKQWLGPLPAAGFRFPSPGQGLLLAAHIDGRQLVSRKAEKEAAGSEAYAWVTDLYFDRLSTAQTLHFARSPLLPSLVGLTLSYCHITTLAVGAMADSPGVANLRWLAVEHVEASAAPLAASPHLGRLRSLWLSHTPTGNDGFKALCDSPHLQELRSLVLIDHGLNGHAGRAFADATGLPALRQLILSGRNGIASDGAMFLTTSPNAARLRRLDLASNAIQDYGVECLCHSKYLCNLTHLDLSNNRLTNRSAVALAASNCLPALRELNLAGNAIAGMGAGAIANSPHVTNLQRLDLSGNPVGEKAAALLRERFGTRVVLG
jgi:uncharacterized protein (TIGR02996 family)